MNPPPCTRATMANLPSVLVTFKGAVQSLRSRSSAKNSLNGRSLPFLDSTMNVDFPSLASFIRTRATAALRRPVPHHQPYLSAGTAARGLRGVLGGFGAAGVAGAAVGEVG